MMQSCILKRASVYIWKQVMVAFSNPYMNINKYHYEFSYSSFQT